MIPLLMLFFLSDVICSDQMFSINIGQDVTFSCLFENASQFDQVSFMHQTTGDLLSVGSDLFIDDWPSNHRMALKRFSPRRLDLQISSVNENDSGLYTCMINDEKLSSYSLEIFIPPRFLSYSPVEASLSFPEASPLNFSCHAHAVPPVNITWIYRNRNKQFKVLHEGEALVIDALEWSDSGSYECVASNGYHGSISRSFYVTVQYRPRVTLKKSVERKFQLLCQACSLPLPKIHWRHNEKNLSRLDDRRIIERTMECLIESLTLEESEERGEFGRFECQASNYLGYQSDHLDLPSPLLKPSSNVRSTSEHVALLVLPPNHTERIFTSSSSSSSCQCSFCLLFVVLVIRR